MIYQLVYVSEYTGKNPENDLYDILETSRKNNPRLNITGLLIFIQGSFIQVLEGEYANVRETYDRIAQDGRHTRLDTLLDHYVPKRLFPDWRMAWMPISESELCALANIKQCDFATLSNLGTNIVSAMLLSFAETQGHIDHS